MKRKAQSILSEDGQRALDQYTHALLHLEDLSPVTIRNSLSDLRQFIAWCEDSWHEEQEDRAVATALLMRYRDYLQTTLKPSAVNRTLLSLKRYFSWTRKTQLVQSNPAGPIKFLPKEASPPRHLDSDEEEALVAAVNATGTLRDQTIITLLLHTNLRAEELCTLTCQQLHLSKDNGMRRIIGKRKKVREVPLNMTTQSILNQYLETLSQECQYLFPSEKTHRAITGQALGHLVTEYATQAQVTNISPHGVRYCFGYWMAEVVLLHGLAQIMGHDSLDTTMLYIRGTKQDLQQNVEKIAWIQKHP